MSAAPQFLEIALAVTATRTPTRKSIPRPHSKPANGLRSVSIKLGGECAIHDAVTPGVVLQSQTLRGKAIH